MQYRPLTALLPGAGVLLIALAVVGPVLHTAQAQQKEGPKKETTVRAGTKLPTALRPDGMRLRRIMAREERLDPGPPIVVEPSGRTLQLRLLPSARPTYYITHALSPRTSRRNAAALATIGAHLVLPGAGLGFAVSGEGERMGLWDASGVRLTHQEWAGRATQRDAPFERRNHASHVAGTLVASGLRKEARGAAPGAALLAHDWNNDLTEMAAWALEGGLVSNHSYGTAGGWVFNARGDGLWSWLGDATVSATEDARFGRYDEQAAAWDEVAAAAPAYLIVKSAGNERADRGPEAGEPYNMFTTQWQRAVAPRPADGGEYGYDTILDASLAKNVLTVGSVGDTGWDGFTGADVRLSSFSSMGPADDGRIKPDVVASGEYVESAFTFSDAAYGTSTGTSHAAPAVAGSTLLLQELGRRLRGAPLGAAMMKALVIHTALDVGLHEGPDYGFGWGLVRVPQAATHIASGPMWEEVLAEGETFSHAVELAEGEPLHVTLAWTDPAGAPGDRLLDDRRPALVNDLDLWVETPGGAILRPWTLDPDHPDRAARRGLNHVDNVEQVSMTAPGSGTYMVRISHTGVLAGGAQAFSLLAGRVPLPAAHEEPGSNVYQIAGHIRTGRAGLPGVRVRLLGAIEAETTSGRDGAYRLEALPAGRYNVRLEFPSAERPPVDAGRVDVPHLGPFNIGVAPLLRLTSFELLRTPHLLEAGESAAERRITAEAGGVYGAHLVFDADPDLESQSVILEVDTHTDPLAAPWIGQRARAWITDLSAWRAAPSEPGPGSQWRARLPLIWISGDAHVGDTVSFGIALRDAESRALLAVDTLRIPVSQSDNQAPLGRFSARLPGLAFAPPGEDAPVEATFWDGSALTTTEGIMVLATDTTREIARVPLADNGDLAAFQDFVPGDGVFSGEFKPPVENDFRLVLVAEDAAGNRSRRMTRIVYSSGPYDRSAQAALWTSSYFTSSTALLWSSLGLANIQAATWDAFVRGQPAAGTFGDHDVLVWVPSTSDLAKTDLQADIIALREAGTRLVVMLPETVPDQARAWLERDLGVQVRPLVEGGAFDGLGGGLSPPDFVSPIGEAEPVFAGWSPRIMARERVAAIEPATSEASPLLMAHRPLAVRSGNALVTTLRAEHVSGSAQRAGYLARLLLLAAGDQVAFAIPASAPDTVLVHARGDTASDSLVVQWPARPAARYDVALENAAADEILSVFTSDTTWAIAASRAAAASRVRIRSLTPTDTSAWATFSFQMVATSRETPPPAPEQSFTVLGVYPQPAAQHASLLLDSPAPGWLDVRIYSVLGRSVGSAARRRLVAGKNRIGLSLGHLAPGVYLVKLATQNGHAAHVSVIRAAY